MSPLTYFAQEEAVRENLKNVVLFMASSGYLVSPEKDPSKERLWTETWKRIDRFLPDLRGDLALEDSHDDRGQPPSESGAAASKTPTVSEPNADSER